MQFSGIITNVSAEEKIMLSTGEESCKKTIVMVNSETEYEQSLAVTFYGDKVSQANVQVGDYATVDFSVRVRESNTKPGSFFNSVRGYRITVK